MIRTRTDISKEYYNNKNKLLILFFIILWSFVNIIVSLIIKSYKNIQNIISLNFEIYLLIILLFTWSKFMGNVCWPDRK
jgi:hypothetical protein